MNFRLINLCSGRAALRLTTRLRRPPPCVRSIRFCVHCVSPRSHRPSASAARSSPTRCTHAHALTVSTRTHASRARSALQSRIDPVAAETCVHHASNTRMRVLCKCIVCHHFEFFPVCSAASHSHLMVFVASHFSIHHYSNCRLSRKKANCKFKLFGA